MLNVYLPGYSLSNQPFVYRFTKKMKKLDWDFYSRKWQHWLDVDSEFSAEKEAELSIQMLDMFDKKGVGIGIIAKSIGVKVMCEIFRKRQYTLKYLILMGIPGNIVETGSLQELITNYADKIIIFQNNKDPVNDIDSIRHLASKNAINEYIEIESDDHKYEYRQELIKLIKPFNN
jgi:hypothetical protein